MHKLLFHFAFNDHSLSSFSGPHPAQDLEPQSEIGMTQTTWTKSKEPDMESHSSQVFANSTWRRKRRKTFFIKEESDLWYHSILHVVRYFIKGFLITAEEL